MSEVSEVSLDVREQTDPKHGSITKKLDSPSGIDSLINDPNMLELRPLPSLLYKERSAKSYSVEQVDLEHRQEIDNIFINSEQNEEEINLDDLDDITREPHEFTEMKTYNKMIEDIMNLDGKQILDTDEPFTILLKEDPALLKKINEQ